MNLVLTWPSRNLQLMFRFDLYAVFDGLPSPSELAWFGVMLPIIVSANSGVLHSGADDLPALSPRHPQFLTADWAYQDLMGSGKLLSFTPAIPIRLAETGNEGARDLNGLFNGII